MATNDPTVVGLDHRVGLEQGDHALDVARTLAGDQEPFEVLRIPRWFALDGRHVQSLPFGRISVSSNDVHVSVTRDHA